MNGNVKTRATAALILAVILGLVLPAGVAAEFTTLPAGFSDDSVVAGLGDPTAIAFLPDGDRLLIATKSGNLFRAGLDGANLTDLNAPISVCAQGERGLLGVAVDPDFSGSSGNIFLYYTHRKGNGKCVNRVSRFTLGSGNQLGNEQALIDNIRSPAANHNGGDLQFDNDGLLYISVGDGGKDVKTGGKQDNNANARRLSLLNGKILRIARDGSIPPGNPFQGPRSVRCAANGGFVSKAETVETEKKSRKKRKRKHRKQRSVCREIFATGLRNPFRIAFDPDDASGQQRFFINDVGGDGFEEIDDGASGADYGWNRREGPCPINNIPNNPDNCSSSSKFVDPLFAYGHGHGAPNDCDVITGGAFVSGGDWPGDYLFADFGCDRLFALTETGSDPDVEEFAAGTGATHLAFGPNGDLYYTTFDGGGQVRRIVDEP